MRKLHRPLLLVAVLGLALAVTASASARCGAGTVKGIAYVTGGSSGVGGLSSAFSASAALFGYRWNCSGGAVEVRKPDSTPPGFDVRFAGNPGKVAIASTTGPAAASVSRNADGSFRVYEAGALGGGFTSRNDLAFVIIVF
jgi:hypothetical protein